MKRVKTSTDVVDGAHFAVIVYNTTSVYIPGDERSRKYPGHGYPEHTKNYDTFEHWITSDKHDLQNFVIKLDNDKKNYIILNISNVCKLKKTVNFNIEFDED